MQIELYSFSKRKNSTKKPTSSGTVVSCVFKEETSVMSPSFELSSGSPIGYNYLKAWTNYYYITDCTFVTNGTWRISCRLDSLATYEATIKGMSAFIEYTDTYDARIFDPRLAKKINATEISESAALPFWNPVGYCVVCVIGNGTCGMYALTKSQVNNMMNNCINWWSQFEQSYSWTTFEEAIKNTCALLITGDAAANIKYCKWIPANAPGGTSKALYAGLYDLNTTGTQMDFDETDTGFITINVPHPSNVMLRTSNTCEYTMYLPCVGNVAFSADVLADESTLTIEYALSNATGDIAYKIQTGSGKTIGCYGANISCDIPIGSSGVSASSVLTTALAGGAVLAGGVGAIAGAGSVAGAAKAGLVTTAKTASAGLLGIQSTSACVGGVGSVAGCEIGMNVHLTCSYWDVSDSGSSLTGLIGNPYYKVDTIGNHGYVACSGASIDAIAYDDITDEINAYLRSGIYVE